MAQTLSVEYDELIARADELEQPMPAAPIGNPQAPCAISFVVGAATQLALSADSLRLYLNLGDAQWRRLAKSLRNAAKAYEEVDEDAAEAITTLSSLSAARLGPADADEMSLSAYDGCEDETPPPPPPPFEYPYYDVRQAATDIEAPDQGTAFGAFATDWEKFLLSLQTTTHRFRPFTVWEGVSATLVEANFEAYRSWIHEMAGLCSTLVLQARRVKDTQRWALTQHPTSYEVWYADFFYKLYKTDPQFRKDPNTPRYLRELQAKYADMQARSEDVLASYISRASLPLPPLYPRRPDSAYQIAPPAPPEPDPTPEPEPDPTPEPDPDPEPTPEPEAPIDELPEEGDDFSELPTTPPSTPTLPSGTPSLSNDDLKDALAGMGGMPTSEPTLKPASVGAGGAGGGLPGMPSMPMQPSVGAESSASSGPGGREMANPGRGVTGMGGAGGPMGGGMAPMAPGGGNQGNKEGKRGPEGDQVLYEEERAWTEGVIGNRRRKDGTDK